MSEFDKPIKAKPTFYAHVFYALREISLKHGYNLVLHGSMDRDLDLIAIAWNKRVSSHEVLLNAIAKHVDGLISCGRDEKPKATKQPHGRLSYHIDLRRGEKHRFRNWIDAE